MTIVTDFAGMNVSIGNIIIIIGLIIAGGIMIWQFITTKRIQDQDDDYYYNELGDAEESVEETEEFMRRMERLSKKTINEDDDKQK